MVIGDGLLTPAISVFSTVSGLEFSMSKEHHQWSEAMFADLGHFSYAAIQTNRDIRRLEQQAARLRDMKGQAIERGHADYDIVIVDTVTECLVQLESVIQLLEAKNETLESAIYIARLAAGKLHKYGTKIPTIPNNE